MVGVDVVVVGKGGLLVVLWLGVVGVFGGSCCFFGSLLAWSGSEVLGCRRGVCCCGVAEVHALHCWMLSCVWAVFVLVSRVLFLLLVLVVILLVGWDVVVVVAFVWVVLLFIFSLFVCPGFCFL